MSKESHRHVVRSREGRWDVVASGAQRASRTTTRSNPHRSRPRDRPEQGRWRGRDSRPPGLHLRHRYRGSLPRSYPLRDRR
jgi:hypothetical protein